jgi:hypothetical protein
MFHWNTWSSWSLVRSNSLSFSTSSRRFFINVWICSSWSIILLLRLSNCAESAESDVELIDVLEILLAWMVEGGAVGGG